MYCVLHTILKFSATAILLCVIHPASGQQKMQFTQYMFNGVVINPAYAGADEALSITAVQRSQWTGIKNAPNTQTISAHSLFKHKRLGLGLTFVNDRVGVHRNQSILTQYAFHIPTAKSSSLSFGLQAGVYNLKSDYASLRSYGGDPQVHDPVLSRTFIDFGAGVYYRSQQLSLGISAPELIPQKFTFNDTLAVTLSKVNLFFFGKYRFAMNEFVNLEPSALVKYLSGVPTSFDINLNMIYREVIVFGVGFRKSESIDLLLKMQVSRQLQLGYSYDHPVGVLGAVANGSHELCVNYIFKDFQQKSVSPRR
jgi:type IX secretion system PorP/SprF family membrane protein